MMKPFILILLLLQLLVSCTPEPIDLQIPQAPEKIVVASQLAEDNYFVVVLSRSFGALEQKNSNINNQSQPFPEELLVTNATVVLQLHDINIELQEVSKGVYATESVFPQHYENYVLRVTDHEKQEHVVALAPMLPKALFDSFRITPVQGKPNQYRLSYSFTDIPGISNWYVVNFYTKDNSTDSLSENPRDIDYIAKRLLEQRLSFDLISEKDIVNGQYSVTKTFTSNNLDTFGIALSNISQGYYEFLYAQKKYASVTNQIRGDVINMPTNVQNGYGYFNLHSPDVHVIRLQDQ